MTVRKIQAKTILNRHKRIDSWFLSAYGMNIYRGCEHDCVYCDGRAEKYRVDGVFGQDVTAKINAPELLQKALDPERKRAALKRAFILLGGGVGDSYQPIEKDLELTRRVLEVIEAYRFPVHVLTKSTLVERDADILTRIGKQSGVIVSMSLSSADDETSRRVEPGTPPPTERLKVLAGLKQKGLWTGIFLLPVLPGITDTQASIDRSVEQASLAGVDFLLFGGLTLKPGRQKDTYFDFISSHDPGLPGRYEKIYPGNSWGAAIHKYYRLIERRFATAALKHRVARRIPSYIFDKVLEENDKITVILDNLAYFTQGPGERSPYGYAAHIISKLKEPLSASGSRILGNQGIDSVCRHVIDEILLTGKSALHESFFFENP